MMRIGKYMAKHLRYIMAVFLALVIGSGVHGNLTNNPPYGMHVPEALLWFSTLACASAAFIFYIKVIKSFFSYEYDSQRGNDNSEIKKGSVIEFLIRQKIWQYDKDTMVAPVEILNQDKSCWVVTVGGWIKVLPSEIVSIKSF